jgi:quercetin dioxygenase-like cupin family protein
MKTRATLHQWDAIALDRVTEMVSRKTMSGSGWTMAQVYLKKGAMSPAHAHDGTQWIYVLQGEVARVVGGERIVAAEGQGAAIPAGVHHQAEAREDSFVLVVETSRGDAGNSTPPAPRLR